MAFGSVYNGIVKEGHLGEQKERKETKGAKGTKCGSAIEGAKTNAIPPKDGGGNKKKRNDGMKGEEEETSRHGKCYKKDEMNNSGCKIAAAWTQRSD